MMGSPSQKFNGCEQNDDKETLRPILLEQQGTNTNRSETKKLSPMSKTTNNSDFDRLKRFPEKLWDALLRNDSGLITWSDDGNSILIDEKRFPKEVMTRHPGLVQIPSFANLRRQLREYGFGWKISKLGEYEFSHPYFMRGRFDLLASVKTRRKVIQDNPHAAVSLAKKRKPKTMCKPELPKKRPDLKIPDLSPFCPAPCHWPPPVPAHMFGGSDGLPVGPPPFLGPPYHIPIGPSQPCQYHDCPPHLPMQDMPPKDKGGENVGEGGDSTHSTESGPPSPVSGGYMVWYPNMGCNSMWPPPPPFGYNCSPQHNGEAHAHDDGMPFPIGLPPQFFPGTMDHLQSGPAFMSIPVPHDGPVCVRDMPNPEPCPGEPTRDHDPFVGSKSTLNHKLQTTETSHAMLEAQSNMPMLENEVDMDDTSSQSQTSTPKQIQRSLCSIMGRASEELSSQCSIPAIIGESEQSKLCDEGEDVLNTGSALDPAVIIAPAAISNDTNDLPLHSLPPMVNIDSDTAESQEEVNIEPNANSLTALSHNEGPVSDFLNMPGPTELLSSPSCVMSSVAEAARSAGIPGSTHFLSI